MSDSLGQDLYSGAAAVGRVSTTIGFIIVVIFGILGIIIGLSLIFQGNVQGWIFLGLSLFFIILAGIFEYLTLKSKTVAALEGVSDIL